MSMDLASAVFFWCWNISTDHFCCGSKDSPLYLFETKMDDHLACLKNSIFDLNSVRGPSLPGHKFHEAPAGWLWDAGFISPWLVCSLNSCCQPGKPVKPGKLVNCRHVSIFTKVSTYEPWCSTTSSLVVHWTTKIWNHGPKLRTEVTVALLRWRLMQSGLLASNTPCDDFAFELLRYFMTSERLDAIRS